MIAIGNLFDLLPTFPENSFSSSVTDAPYELGFMGKSWDRSGVAFKPETWAEVLRVLTPGAHLVCFGAPKNGHRVACAIEDAGFEIRDSLAYMFGTGFPKSLDFAKAQELSKHEGRRCAHAEFLGTPFEEGWGTALKPGYEPIILARKPLAEKTLFENVFRWGTGALNVDGCRIECSPEDFEKLSAGVEKVREKGGVRGDSWKNSSDLSGANPANPLGRWPANVILDEEAAALLDEQTGDRPGLSGGGTHKLRNCPDCDGAGCEDGAYRNVDCPTCLGEGKLPYDRSGVIAGGGHDCPPKRPADSGGASRFFYTAKASQSERHAGLDHFPAFDEGEATGGRKAGSDGLKSPRAGAGRTQKAGRNPHPTVKKISLMR